LHILKKTRFTLSTIKKFCDLCVCVFLFLDSEQSVERIDFTMAYFQIYFRVVKKKYSDRTFKKKNQIFEKILILLLK